jgi:hypothetical protein
MIPELRLPLTPESGRNGHEHPRVTVTVHDVADDPAGLHRLAEADFVTQENTRRAVRYRQCRVELICQHARAGGSRAQAIHARGRGKRRDTAPPPAQPDATQTSNHRLRRRPVERPEQDPAATVGDAAQVKFCAVVVRDDGLDDPAFTPRPDFRARFDAWWQWVRTAVGAIFAASAVNRCFVRHFARPR